MRHVGSALQLVGIGSLTVGAFLLAAWLGFVIAGIGVFAVGFQLERLSR